MDVLVLRFDSPLMSFGAVLVDQFNRTDRYPYRAMLVGLFANALGLRRTDVDEHQSLQRRCRYAARRDREGTEMVDFQTVDLGTRGSMSSELGWTAEGRLEQRKGGDAAEGTHIRYRHYVADAIVTVVCTLSEPGTNPSMDAVEQALRHPVRPLFVGRKCCVPSVPVLVERTQSASLRAAIEAVPRLDDARTGRWGNERSLPAIWPAEATDGASHRWMRVENRDWVNAIHVGRSRYVRGTVSPPEPATAQGREP